MRRTLCASGQRLACAALLVTAALAPAFKAAAAARDYILTGIKPDRLVVVDAAARQVKSVFKIAGANDFVTTIVPSPDGRVAYVLVNRLESIVGIDLQTGAQVFRADLSSPTERVKCFFAFDVSPDGRELVVYELPTRLDPDEYVVEQPRFAVFNTSAGVAAKPTRQFSAPRRVHLVLFKKGGRSFYALGFDLLEYDAQSGREIGKRGIRNWNFPAHGQPDVLAVWPVSEASGVFTTPAYADAVSPGKAPVPKTSLMQLDLQTGELSYHDFEETAALIFSTVLNPSRTKAYGTYSQLSLIDTRSYTLEKRVDLPHTFYAINIASDGHELYLGGAMCDVAFYDPATLEQRANLRLPGCADQALASLRVIHH